MLIRCPNCGFGGEAVISISDKEEKISCPACGKVKKWITLSETCQVLGEGLSW